MKALTQTIIVIAALSLLAAAFAPARNVSGEGFRDSFEIQAREAEVATELAQAQTSGPVAPVEPVLSSIPSAGAPPIPPAPPTDPASVNEENINTYNLVRNLSLGSRSGSTGTVLVIPSEQTSTEDLLTINEDMSVMSRIFEKNLEQAHISTARGDMYMYSQYSTFLGSGGGGIQSIYLQGFGALFLMKVDFPLTPPPGMQDDEKETQKAEQGDPVWRQMRREMYEPKNVRGRYRTDRPEEKYDAEKVENFKTTLIKALKHAANIRSMKKDESVILTVTGKGQAIGTTIVSAMHTGKNQIIISERVGDGKTRTRIVEGTSLDNIGLSSPTILVVRTKKSDIDEFAKGDLDFNKFRQRVQMLTYPLLGGAAERGGPFDIYYNDIVRPRSTSSSNRR